MLIVRNSAVDYESCMMLYRENSHQLELKVSDLEKRLDLWLKLIEEGLRRD